MIYDFQDGGLCHHLEYFRKRLRRLLMSATQSDYTAASVGILRTHSSKWSCSTLTHWSTRHFHSGKLIVSRSTKLRSSCIINTATKLIYAYTCIIMATSFGIRLCKMQISISTTREFGGFTKYTIGDRLALLVSFCALFSRGPTTGRADRPGW